MSSSLKANGSSRPATTTSTETNGAIASNNSAPDTDAGMSGLKQGLAAWREFQEVTKKVFRHSRVYDEIERTMERQSALESELQTLKNRTLELESNKQSQISAFEARYDQWKRESTMLEEKRHSAQQATAAVHIEEIQQVKKNLASEKGRADSLARKLERAIAETTLLKKELDIRNEHLRQWEYYTRPLTDVDFASLQEKMKQIFQDFCTLVKAHFEYDVPLVPPRDHSDWERQIDVLKLPLSFPPTNSPTAQCIRMAAALNVLATRLCDNIFKPCYIPESATGTNTIKEILDYQFMAGLRKEEQLTRALLISTYPPERVREATIQAVETTLQDVLEHLHVFLGDRVETFGSELKPILQRAAKLALEMQRSKKMVKVSVEDGDLMGHSDEYLGIFGELVPPTGPPKFEVLSLFPRIWVPEDDTIVHEGVVLWPDQEIVVVADQELRTFKAERKAKNGRGMSGTAQGGIKRERRQSVVFGGGKEIVSSPPNSPGVGRNTFLERGAQHSPENAIQH